MIVEIEIPTGKLLPTGRFTYTKQVGDIGDVSTSTANHTNSFSVRKDNESIIVLEGLGTPTSASKIPYKKTPANLRVDYFEIIKSGWLQVEKSDKSAFKLSILDGNVDFWKRIEGVTLEDIDLSETKHTKNVATIIDSFDNPFYKYILADYGGEEHDYDNNAWNGDFLVPSINEKYILDRIFEHIGMSYNLSVNIDTWLTYPKDVYDGFGYDPAIEVKFDSYVSGIVQPAEKIQPEPSGTNNTDNAEWDLPSYTVKIKEPGVYKISHEMPGILVNVVFYRTIKTPLGKFVVDEYESWSNGFVFIYVNDVFSGAMFYPDSEININLNEGDVVEFRFKYYTDTQFYPSVPENAELAYVKNYLFGDYKFVMERHNFLEISFGDAFRDIQAKDFIKYIMMRYGLTIFTEGNEVTFLTIDERLNAPAQNFTNMVKEKIEERYVYPNYAVKNALRHKYVDDTDDWQDGYIYSSENLMEDEKTLFESFTHSRTTENQMPVFQTEVKELNGVIEVSYKSILGRFFSLGVKMKLPDHDTTIYTEKIPASQTHQGAIPLPDFEMTTFRQFVPAFWQPIERLIQRAKLSKFTMDMTIADFIKIDLKKRVYIGGDESAYFLINSATLKDDREVELELIKID